MTIRHSRYLIWMFVSLIFSGAMTATPCLVEFAFAENFGFAAVNQPAIEPVPRMSLAAGQPLVVPRAYDDARRIPAPPAVKDLLTHHCIICHSDTSQDFGRLDMSEWVDTPDGVRGFVQFNASGAQRPSRETFQRILGRVTSDDADRKMPLGYKLHPGNELAPFVAWLEERLAEPRSAFSPSVPVATMSLDPSFD